MLPTPISLVVANETDNLSRAISPGLASAICMAWYVPISDAVSDKTRLTLRSVGITPDQRRSEFGREDAARSDRGLLSASRHFLHGESESIVTPQQRGWRNHDCLLCTGRRAKPQRL